jgi:hypothetical protein
MDKVRYIINVLFFLLVVFGCIFMSLYFVGCSTPVLTTVGPKWQLKAGCEMKATSNDYYATARPENKCGGVLEVIIVQGGK